MVEVIYILAQCVNTPVSFYCKCPPGYKLDISGRDCRDVNECQVNQIKNPTQQCISMKQFRLFLFQSITSKILTFISERQLHIHGFASFSYLVKFFHNQYSKIISVNETQHEVSCDLTVMMSSHK